MRDMQKRLRTTARNSRTILSALGLLVLNYQKNLTQNIPTMYLLIEFLNWYRQKYGSTLRERVFAYQPQWMKPVSLLPWFYNWMVGNQLMASWLAGVLGLDADVPYAVVTAVNAGDCGSVGC